MNEALLSEVERISGMKRPEGVTIEAWSANPSVKWAVPTVANIMIDAIIPETIIRSFGLYTDIKYVGYGEVAQFDVEPNALFTVSEAGNAQRTTFKQKQFRGSKNVIPVNHDVTVYVSLYRVLCGQESLAEFVRKAVISVETLMTVDAYSALNALVAGASYPAALVKTGFTKDNALKLAQTVEAYNNAKPVFVGTALALSEMLPDSAEGYRINADANDMRIQLMKNYYGYDLMVLPQVATGKNFGLALSDEKIYVMSPSVDKVLKMAIEGNSMLNSNDYFDTANLNSNATLNKRWGVEAVSAAVMGVINLQ